MFKRILLPAAGVAMLLATPAFAQIPPGYTAPMPQPPQGDLGPGGRAQNRLQAAHDRLGITPAQQPQWDAVVATLRDNARAMRNSPARQAIRSDRLDGVQALRAAADLARQRADAMQRLIPAVEGLYGVLSPQQREVADREIDHMVHGHGPRQPG